MFALTQVTARLARDLSAGGLGQGVLILGAIRWAWAAYAWLTNEVDGARAGVRLAIFASMAAMLLASLAIPAAFEEHALLFALAYLAVRVLHIVLFAAGTDDVDVRQAAAALAPTAVLAPALLIVASAFESEAVRVAIWMNLVSLAGMAVTVAAVLTVVRRGPERPAARAACHPARGADRRRAAGLWASARP